MPLVTAIKPQKTKDRFNVFIDGHFAFGLDATNLVKAGLKVNQEITSAQAATLVKENEFQKSFDKALRFLSLRPRSEKELTDWFQRKEIGAEVQKQIIEKLRNLGYLNDREFAKWWIEQRLVFKVTSQRLLTTELQRKGVDREIISELLEHSLTREGEVRMAQKFAEKKYKTLQGLPAVVVRRKLSEGLMRRGFNWEIIKAVTAKLVKDERES